MDATWKFFRQVRLEIRIPYDQSLETLKCSFLIFFQKESAKHLKPKDNRKPEIPKYFGYEL